MTTTVEQAEQLPTKRWKEPNRGNAPTPGKGRWELLGQRLRPIRVRLRHRVGPADCPRAFLHQPLISPCLGLRANGEVAPPLSALVAVHVHAGGVRVRVGKRGVREYEDCELRQGGRLQQQLLRLGHSWMMYCTKSVAVLCTRHEGARLRGMRYLRAEYWRVRRAQGSQQRLVPSDIRHSDSTVLVRHGRASQVAQSD